MLIAVGVVLYVVICVFGMMIFIGGDVEDDTIE